MAFTPILFGYDSSPYAGRVRLYCAAAGINYKYVEQPSILPRPTLENIGITYRKIPVLAIGKDVYADSNLIIDVLQSNFNSKLATSTTDKAFENFGNDLFGLALRIIPVKTLDPAFAKDRETIFPALNRPDHDKQRPSAVAELRACFDVANRQFLGHGKPFINGNEITLSDVNIAWVVDWLLNGAFGLGKQAGFGKEDFPNIYAWLEKMPAKKSEKFPENDAVKEILSASYFAKETAAIPSEPSGLSIGDEVSAETADAVPGAHTQNGKIVGLTIDTVTLQLKNELHVHLPRRGTVVTKN